MSEAFAGLQQVLRARTSHTSAASHKVTVSSS